jgi:arylsulfatase A-like enzyme
MKHTQPFSRRDVLKLLSIAPLSVLVQPLAKYSPVFAGAPVSNIIVLVFDAWSGDHLALNDYPRTTMPAVEKFAERAIVYHHHFAAGPFTVPGTASLLTGLYPWTHRAFLLGSGITPSHAEHQMFVDLHPDHSTVGYSQNKFADQFLFQADKYLDAHLRSGGFNLQDNLISSNPIFRKDERVAYLGFDGNLFIQQQGYSGSLFLGDLFQLVSQRQKLRSESRYDKNYPRGLPQDNNKEYFLLPDVVDGAINALRDLKQPSLVYLHFYPPHDPYRPTQEFFGKFNKDKWQPTPKPVHPLTYLTSDGVVSDSDLKFSQNFYDDYLRSWDAEVSRLFDFLQVSGLLNRSYVFLTSDHGEMHERGYEGHMGKMLFDSVMRIPLIVSQPGQTERVDIKTNTSAVDVVPTIAHLAGKPIPAWAEGTILPGLGGVVDNQRSIYIMDAILNSAFKPLTKYSVSMTKGRYRLTQYSLPKYRGYEFYDIENDRDELHDLYPSLPAIAMEMQEEMQEKLDEVNKPFLKNT